MSAKARCSDAIQCGIASQEWSATGEPLTLGAVAVEVDDWLMAIERHMLMRHWHYVFDESREGLAKLRHQLRERLQATYSPPSEQSALARFDQEFGTPLAIGELEQPIGPAHHHGDHS